ncbi:glycerophosphodiester phosphodiesterase family protein [Gaetbulibacter sp. NE]|uniref:glycerophosphodiester phosphodiesterase family protein n=1 Tax=Gaetbulibacter sp. NE TaxID=2982307 RepID=UPI0021D00D90|nr:glycerophosphodiester phosphodiesterase family protein [Gaetbulibacter sp. NE]
MSCNTNTTIGVQGHRGCRGLLPENSLPAFEKAVALGVNTLELDLAISKDKQVVVSHEPFMSRFYCLKPNGEEISINQDLAFNFYEMDYDSIKLFDCGTKQHPRFPQQKNMKTYKPLLSEVFKLSDALNSEIRYNIEIKAKPEYDNIYTPEPKEYVALVLKVIDEYNIGERCNLQSFDVRILEEIKRQAPSMTQALLVDENEVIADKLNALSFKPEIISPYFQLLTKDVVAQYQKEGYSIIPWTVNEKEDMHTVISYGVNSIITDYPDVLIGILND